jgi:D-glycero-alpha-D-manno-heptose-7-phosphate kinase
MLRVRATTPTRIDLAGGTLDIWPIPHILDHKATVNVGITLMASAEVSTADDGQYLLSSQDQGEVVTGSFAHVVASKKLPLLSLLLSALWHPKLPPLHLKTSAQSPAGAGLGGSSCLGIAVAGALWRARQLSDGWAPASDAQLVQLVGDVEARLIQTPTGIQDYWGGIRGQINLLSYPYGRVNVETLGISRLPRLSEELIVCYSGKSRASAINNWEIFKRLFDGDKSLLETFNAIGLCAEQCAEAVRTGDYEQVVSLSAKEWQLRVKLWPNIETTETKRLDKAALTAGARLTRVCGAGGGGVMAVLAPASKKKDVETALRNNGGQILAATVAPLGLNVENF